jgi:hypothetical protein
VLGSFVSNFYSWSASFFANPLLSENKPYARHCHRRRKLQSHSCAAAALTPPIMCGGLRWRGCGCVSVSLGGRLAADGVSGMNVRQTTRRGRRRGGITRRARSSRSCSRSRAST